MISKTIQLKKGKEESLNRFHPWIFSGAILKKDDDIEEGEVVRVYTYDKRFIGAIAVRGLSFSDTEISLSFWVSRLQSAFDMRRAIGLADLSDNNTFRLVHGEGDNLPGLIIDCYGTTAVMQAHSVGMHRQRQEICEALKQVMGNRIESVYYKSETTLPFSSTNERIVACLKNMRKVARFLTCFATLVVFLCMPCEAELS